MASLAKREVKGEAHSLNARQGVLDKKRLHIGETFTHLALGSFVMAFVQDLRKGDRIIVGHNVLQVASTAMSDRHRVVIFRIGLFSETGEELYLNLPRSYPIQLMDETNS